MADLDLEVTNVGTRQQVDLYYPKGYDATPQVVVKNQGEQTEGRVSRRKFFVKEQLNPMGAKGQEQRAHQETMKKLGETLAAPSARSPEERFDRILTLIEEYQQRINDKLAALHRGENVDLDVLAQDAHTLLMLNLGKERENERLLAELSTKTIIILRDEIKETTNTWGELSLTILGNGLMIAGGLGGMMPSSVLDKFFNVVRVQDVAAAVKDFFRAGKSLGQVGQGVNGFTSIVSNKNNSDRTLKQTNQELAKSAEGTHRSGGQSSQSQAERILQLILELQKRRSETASNINNR